LLLLLLPPSAMACGKARVAWRADSAEMDVKIRFCYQIRDFRETMVVVDVEVDLDVRHVDADVLVSDLVPRGAGRDHHVAELGPGCLVLGVPSRGGWAPPLAAAGGFTRARGWSRGRRRCRRRR
jgi:hypothetical protein